MRDTSPDRQDDYFRRLRELTPEQRGRIAARLTASVRRLAEAGIRSRHPEALEAEVRIRLAVRLYGRAEARRLLGAIPDDAV